MEDINNDQTLSESEGYYQYRINLKPDELVQGSNYINDKYTDSTQGPSFGTRWIQFKILSQEWSLYLEPNQE